MKWHGKKCKCCICRGISIGKDAAAAQVLGQPGKLMPCICGSKVCEKSWKTIKQEHIDWKLRQALNKTKCVCGSSVCKEESVRMPEILLEEAKLADYKKRKAKEAKKAEKQYQKDRKKRAKILQKELKKQDKFRKKQDKLELKAIRKGGDVGNVRTVVESLIDLGSFGSKAFCDIGKFLSRTAMQPRDTYLEFKDMASYPGETKKTMQRKIDDLGLISTAQRIKLRLSRMPAAKSAIKQLESYPTTNYLLHMADKDPRKRMKKFKKKNVREPFEFSCSLYMSSIRKRPCLRVYYTCPWFYPHCMSLLGVWKQFQDILLFILAVTVWSPCIICMELIRGFVCCIMCQG